MKLLKSLIVFTITFTLFFDQTVYAAYDPRTSRQYDDTLAPFYIESVNDVSGNMISYVLRTTPQLIWDLFYQEGVRIYITQTVPKSERLANNSNYSYYDGICYPATFSYNQSNKKIGKITAPVEIYIYSNVTRVDTYFHECGHALDCIAEYITGSYQGPKPISNSSEWQALYSKYGSVMATFDGNASVNMYNSCEAFAEAYRLYFSYPQKLQSTCPEVYTFVLLQIAMYASYVPLLSYENFDYYRYALDYPDVYAAYGYDKKQLWNHYINFGQNEGREANKIVTPKR